MTNDVGQLIRVIRGMTPERFFRELHLRAASRMVNFDRRSPEIRRLANEFPPQRVYDLADAGYTAADIERFLIERHAEAQPFSFSLQQRAQFIAALRAFRLRPGRRRRAHR